MKKSILLSTSFLACGALVVTTLAFAEPVNYTLDPDHTHPSFEVDHLGGLSVWRGTFKSTHGNAVLDRAIGFGTVDVTIDTGSIDFGLDALNKHVASPDMLDASQYPTATYHGQLGGWQDGVPSSVTGQLTLHGVTRPVNLQIDSFKCIIHPVKEVEVCGADAVGTFNRADFGIDYGQKLGFRQDVALRIQVEGSKDK
jgi:polyisoprenoid-binding protein YceI